MKQETMEMPKKSETEKLVESIRRKDKIGEKLTPREINFRINQRKENLPEDNPR